MATPRGRRSVRGRRCLLKGCGRRFVPRPQDMLRGKYCTSPCRRTAKRHRKWLWKRTPRGRDARRRESARYRARHPTYQADYRASHLERVREIERESKRRCRRRRRHEGPSAEDPAESVAGPFAGDPVHKGGSDDAGIAEVQCCRPGCYHTFRVPASLKAVYCYCRKGCAAIMRRFRSLCAQLRYRLTLWGNYVRKHRGTPIALRSAPAPP
jgi:hypothetical protein